MEKCRLVSGRKRKNEKLSFSGKQKQKKNGKIFPDHVEKKKSETIFSGSGNARKQISCKIGRKNTSVSDNKMCYERRSLLYIFYMYSFVDINVAIR